MAMGVNSLFGHLDERENIEVKEVAILFLIRCPILPRRTRTERKIATASTVTEQGATVYGDPIFRFREECKCNRFYPEKNVNVHRMRWDPIFLLTIFFSHLILDSKVIFHPHHFIIIYISYISSLY